MIKIKQVSKYNPKQQRRIKSVTLEQIQHIKLQNIQQLQFNHFKIK